jgi:hypothetical protein
MHCNYLLMRRHRRRKVGFIGKVFRLQGKGVYKPDVMRYEQAYIDAWSQPGALACSLKYYHALFGEMRQAIKRFVRNGYRNCIFFAVYYDKVRYLLRLDWIGDT